MISPTLHRYTTLDSGMLCRLFRSDDVFIPSADDHTKPTDIQRFIDNALASPAIYLLGKDPKREAFIFAPSHNATTYQVHAAVRADSRDRVVSRVGEAARWIFEHTECRSLISFVREDNAGVRSMLSQAGMTRCGKLKKSVCVSGSLEDELIYQITLEDYLALWGEG